ncbi:hypothetical protein V496_08043 [Pseudogymnoascus sp. VKM F-4515 (FW-2607)]|nr:hypothetical protein V496_08043 [Pseudogymnoascus sp. VKM F-4515 (FW-2607)]KFY81775.1 hypothetical protein V498_08697 [Pseudogymnoascus sp. VKM F-4517 (FW-2822)]
MRLLSNELPMNNKPNHPFANQEHKVKELLHWLRVAKSTALFLLFAVLGNFVLMYGLIRYPCKPSPAECSTYCTAINAPRMVELPPPIEVAKLIPTSSSPVSTEVVVRQSKIEVRGADFKESKDLSVRPTSEVSTYLEDRNRWWILAMSGFWTANQLVAWWNMVEACKDFSDASNVINCVWGAVTTAITAAGAFWGGQQTFGRLQVWLGNNAIQFGGFKRDEAGLELLDNLSTILSSPVTHLGAFNFAPLGLNGTLSKRTSKDPIDVFGFTSPEGLPMHFSFLGHLDNMDGNGKKQFAFKFGIGPGVVPVKVKGREIFNHQYFTKGGIDFLLNENIGEGGVLSTKYDYTQMLQEVECLMRTGSTAAGHFFQIFDNDRKGTIAGGAVAPFRGSDHWSAITQMYHGKWPLPLDKRCT